MDDEQVVADMAMLIDALSGHESEDAATRVGRVFILGYLLAQRVDIVKTEEHRRALEPLADALYRRMR